MQLTKAKYRNLYEKDEDWLSIRQMASGKTDEEATTAGKPFYTEIH